VRAILIAITIAGFVVLATTTSRSDTDPGVGSGAPAEPPEQPPPSPAMRSPFTPYEIGPPEAAWPYEALTADEKAVADAAHDHDFTAAHDGYAAAVRARSVKARAESAAILLGVEDLEHLGVVP
jgi:hypothetical protein